MKVHLKVACSLLLSLALAACSGQGASSLIGGGNQTLADSGGGIPGSATSGNSKSTSPIKPLDVHGGILSVELGDAAPSLGGQTLAHLNLGIREIDAISPSGTTQVLATYPVPMVVDVLQFQDNNGADVSETPISVRNYHGLRFVVDRGASQAIFSNGQKTPLNFMTNTSTFSPIGAGSTTTTIADGPGNVDIITNQPFSIGVNQFQSIHVDFNAYESLALQPGGMLTTLPALFIAPDYQSGQITGQVLNSWGQPVPNATVAALTTNGSVGNTTFTDSNGNFELHTLIAGSYQLMIYNSYTNAAGAQYQSSGATSSASAVNGPSVTVTAGQTTSVGTLAD